MISDYLATIRHNTPTTFILSYGYLSAFLGLDHLRAEATLPPFGLADTWGPVLCCILGVDRGLRDDNSSTVCDMRNFWWLGRA